MRAQQIVHRSLIALAVLSVYGIRGAAQQPGQHWASSSSANSPASAPSANSPSPLPDSPGTVLANSETSSSETTADAPALTVRNIQNTSVMPPAHRFSRVVQPFQEAPPLTDMGKIDLSIMSRFTLGEAFSTVAGAGWSQWRDSRPHYGTNEVAFGKRVGALAIKQTSQSFFAYGVYAAAFHDDPRYYIMGSTVPVVHRAVYSGTRTFITQKDDGRRAINWSKLAGIATATALTTAYYPKVDRGFGNESKAFGTSIGTSMMNDEIHEFMGDALHLIHHNQ